MPDRKKVTFWFWVLVISLISINTLDIFLIQRYQGGVNWQRETFPFLSYSLQYYGIDASIWLIRAVMWPSLFILTCLPRTRYVNYFLFFLNLLYYTSMTGWLFVLGIVGSVK